MISKKTAEQVLARALKTGGDFAEIFLEDRRSGALSLVDGHVEDAVNARKHGAGIRIYDGLRSIYVYTCDVTTAGLLRAAERAAAAVKRLRYLVDGSEA